MHDLDGLNEAQKAGALLEGSAVGLILYKPYNSLMEKFILDFKAMIVDMYMLLKSSIWLSATSVITSGLCVPTMTEKSSKR